MSNELQKKLESSTLFIAGIGMGSLVAEVAARTGFGRFILADGDRVELSNLNRQIFTESQIGMNKAVATAERLLSIRSDLHIEVIDRFLTPETVEDPISRSDLVVDTIDWDPAFLACDRFARKHRKHVLLPMNLGWGGALYVFSPDGPGIDEVFGLSVDREYDRVELKKAIVNRALGESPPSYFEGILQRFAEYTPSSWPYDPQLAPAVHLMAAVVTRAAVSIVAGEPIRIAPDVIRFDMLDLVSRQHAREF